MGTIMANKEVQYTSNPRQTSNIECHLKFNPENAASKTICVLGKKFGTFFPRRYDLS